ncbi:uncharacterized protein LOC131855070 [Achroia grisella]|uniref:uncharacterized protein LOC131855070 n=1 Tax=Achroia grisella TaxID=688607 RepID=UPI0027D2D9AB|nr:uncharacterized protein LOC131855070 [Achroia grisella]
MSNVLKVVFSISILVWVFAQADPIDDLKKEYASLVMECVAVYPITVEEVELMKNGTLPKNTEVNCLLACAYKKTGMMEENGMLSIEGINKQTEKYFSDNPEKMKKAREFIDACKGVNDEAVSDGEKGCDRAALIFTCTAEKAPGAKTDDEIKADFIKLVMQCTSEHPIDMSELTQLQKLIVPKKPEVRCLLACAYRKEGIMTSKGTYDIDHAYKMAEENANGDDNRKENAKKLADICVKVNDSEVSDGEKGCDRAALLLKCLIDNAPKLGFKL